MVLALLVVPKANRNLKAWLVLIPLVVVMLLWQLPTRLLSIPDPHAGLFGAVFKSLALGWAAAWLLSCWLSGRHPLVAFFSVLAVLAAIGAVAYGPYFSVADGDEFLAALLTYGGCSLSLVMAMTLSAWCCRPMYGAHRFLIWLAVWLGVAVVVASVGAAVAAVMIDSFGLLMALVFVVQAVVISVALGFALYLFNLPFMVMALQTAFYGDRFRKLLRLKDRTTWRMGQFQCDRRSASAAGWEAAAEPLRAEDVVGQWKFYLDSLSKTVHIDFHSDGKFAQKIVSNQGGVMESPGGTWRLDGPRIRLDGYMTAEEGASQSREWRMTETPAGLAVLGGDEPDPDSFFRMRRAQPTVLAESPAG